MPFEEKELAELHRMARRESQVGSARWAQYQLILYLGELMSALTQPIIDATAKLQGSVANLQSVLPPGSTIAAPTDATDITNAATSISSAADAVQTLAVQLGFTPPAQAPIPAPAPAA